MGCGFVCFSIRESSGAMLSPSAWPELTSQVEAGRGAEGEGKLLCCKSSRSATTLKHPRLTSFLRLSAGRMLSSVSRALRRRQLGPAQRWLSASPVRNQLDFSPAGEAAILEDTESQPNQQTKGRDMREDPPYEEWLATIGRQYKRTDRRSWLGGSVVRQCPAFRVRFSGS